MPNAYLAFSLSGKLAWRVQFVSRALCCRVLVAAASVVSLFSCESQEQETVTPVFVPPTAVAPSVEPSTPSPGICDGSFVCDGLPACEGCSCECPGLYQLWAAGVSSGQEIAVGVGPNGYAILSDTPEVVNLDTRGRSTGEGFALSWLQPGVGFAFGVARDNSILVAGEVSPNGMTDIHIERLSPAGDLLFSQTLDLTEGGHDNLLGGRVLPNGSLLLVAEGVVGELDSENNWRVVYTSGALAGSRAMVGTQRFVTVSGGLYRLYDLQTGYIGQYQVIEPSRSAECAIELDPQDQLVEVCATNYDELKTYVSPLSTDFVSLWTQSATHRTSVVVSAAGVADGIVKFDSPGGLIRYNRLGEEVARTTGLVPGMAIPIAPHQILNVRQGGGLELWVAPPRRESVRDDNESCANDSDCGSGLCCKVDATKLGVCGGAEGCQRDSLCLTSNTCAGQCDADIAGNRNPVCREFCEVEDDCASGYSCVAPCDSGDCKPVCLRSCLTSGAEDCEANEVCAELASTLGFQAFVCRPACVAQACGVDGDVACNNCPAGSRCDGSQCEQICAPGSCGEIDEMNCGECPSGQVCEENQCRAACLDMECGEDFGVSCGTCGATEYCESGECRTACLGKACGDDHGLDCGTCGEREYCSEGACLAACGDQACGTDHDVECGECGERQFCASDGQCQAACIDMECGANHGVNCGSCLEHEFCTTSQTCVVPCANMECGTNYGEYCGECSAGEYCTSDHHCVFSCAEGQCGTNGEQECGACPLGQFCDDQYQCQNLCEGLACGTDHGMVCGFCDEGSYCHNGACVPGACDPAYAFHCVDAEVYTCGAGETITPYTTCPDDEYCDHTQVEPCRPRSCIPSEPLCIDDSFTTCDYLGAAPFEGRDQCAKQGLSCSLLGCGDITQSLIVGANEPLLVPATWTTGGNVVRMGADATLERFGFEGAVPADTTGVWHVFESTAESGPYVRVAYRNAEVSASQSTHDGPTFGIPLKADHYYLFLLTALGMQFETGVAAVPFAMTLGIEVDGFLMQEDVPDTLEARDSIGYGLVGYVSTIQLPTVY